MKTCKSVLPFVTSFIARLQAVISGAIAPDHYPSELIWPVSGAHNCNLLRTTVPLLCVRIEDCHGDVFGCFIFLPETYAIGKLIQSDSSIRVGRSPDLSSSKFSLWVCSFADPR